MVLQYELTFTTPEPHNFSSVYFTEERRLSRIGYSWFRFEPTRFLFLIQTDIFFIVFVKKLSVVDPGFPTGKISKFSLK